MELQEAPREPSTAPGRTLGAFVLFLQHFQAEPRGNQSSQLSFSSRFPQWVNPGCLKRLGRRSWLPSQRPCVSLPWDSPFPPAAQGQLCPQRGPGPPSRAPQLRHSSSPTQGCPCPGCQPAYVSLPGSTGTDRRQRPDSAPCSREKPPPCREAAADKGQGSALPRRRS